MDSWLLQPLDMLGLGPSPLESGGLETAVQHQYLLRLFPLLRLLFETLSFINSLPRRIFSPTVTTTEKRAQTDYNSQARYP
jgi:hypothetical protein